MSLWICPICGKQCSINLYDPTDFDDDILIIVKRGLGKGKGFEVVEKYSLLDGSDPELLDLISDRVAVVYDMLYEDVEDDDEAEDGDEEQAQPMTALDREIQIAEEEENEDEDEEEDEDISDLDEDVIE